MPPDTPQFPSPEILRLVDDPLAGPFLPLIYAAWADGDLSDQELSALRTLLAGKPWLPKRTGQILDSWLHAGAPPGPALLNDLLARLRQRAEQLPEAERRSLVGLGAALPEEPPEPQDEVQRALREARDAIGIAGEEISRELFLPEREARPQFPPAPEFDSAALGELLDGRHRSLRRRLRELLSEPEFHPPTGLSTADYRKWTYERLQRLAAEKLGGLSYPIEFGGEGDMEKFLLAFETLAYGDLSLLIKFGVQFGLFGGSIRMLGTARHHKRYLRDVAELRLPGCFAMTELGHGSNVSGIETEAHYDRDRQEFVVHTPHNSARKEYIGNAACHGRLATVFAQLFVDGQGHGVHALLVPIRDHNGRLSQGVRIEDCGEKLGLNGVDNGRIWFDRVRVPWENLLNRYAEVTPEGEYLSPIPSASKRFFTMLGALVAGRVSLMLASVSAAKSGLAIAVRYGDRRRQFGPAGGAEIPVLDYLAHQRRLLPRLATAYALDFAGKYLVQRYQQRSDGDQREVEALAAGLKAYSSWFAVETLQTCRECCGGQGYMTVNRFAALKADTDIFTTFEGDNTVLMQLLAKGLLSEYRRQFEDLRPYTILKYLGRRAEIAIAERNPVTTHKTDEDHLRGAELHAAAFRFREEALLRSAARRLRHRLDNGMDSFHAFNECQDHLIALARAHVEGIIHERFAAAVLACEDALLRAVLDDLRALYALSRLEADRAWFLESGYFAAAKSRAVRAQVNALCGKLRPSAEALVDAFGIPEAVLAAPIAGHGYVKS